MFDSCNLVMKKWDNKADFTYYFPNLKNFCMCVAIQGDRSMLAIFSAKMAAIISHRTG